MEEFLGPPQRPGTKGRDPGTPTSDSKYERGVGCIGRASETPGLLLRQTLQDADGAPKLMETGPGTHPAMGSKVLERAVRVENVQV
jgi:hypothetical protein